MITAAGAGASFVAVPSKRLKPKTPRSPRNTTVSSAPGSRSNSQQSRIRSPSSPPHPQEAAAPSTLGTTPSFQSFLFSRSSQSPSSEPAVPVPHHHLPIYEESDNSKSFLEEDFFGLHPLAQTIEDQDHEPPSPKSFYSADTTSTTSTTSTTKAGGRSSEDSTVFITQLQHPPPRKTARKLQRPRPSSPPSASSQTSLSFISPGTSPTGLGIGPFANYTGSHLSGHSITGSQSQYGEHYTGLKDFENMSSNNSTRDICIAVVGARGVGKSTFIQKAYDLKSPSTKDMVSCKFMTVERSQCNVILVELDWAKLDFGSQPLVWPRMAADGQRLPFVDGVLILYDVTNQESISKLSESLDALARALLPALVVSCKCDAPQRQLNPSNIENLGAVGGYETMQTSIASPDSQKKCLNVILNMIVRKNEKSARHLNGRRRANSSATNNSRTTSPRPSTGRSGHSRASSEFSTTYLKDGSESSSHGHSRLTRSPINPALGTLALNSSTSLSSGQLFDTRPQRVSGGATPQITLSSTGTGAPYLEVVSDSPFSITQQNLGTASLRSNSMSYQDLDRARGSSFLDMDDEDTIKDPDDIPLLDRESGVDEFDDGDKPAQSRGYTWDELVDRLLRQTMSRGDQDFAKIFLCFFRKFAPPRDLLNSILDRFDQANSDPIALHRISAQLRYCTILCQWVTSHPGDFAHPKTRQRLISFLNVIMANRSLALLATEMRKTLAQGHEDDDSIWAISDSDTERRDSLRSFLTTHSVSQDSVTTTDGYSGIRAASDGALNVPTETDFNRRRASEVPTMSTVNTASSQSLLRGEGFISSMTPWNSQYDLFMGIPDEDIAYELTRMDWQEFSKIKPRDLLISHFNHVAYWVASVILEKPKPKHRAKALEKFMSVAWSLRHMNNYNALGAVIAGINGTAVHRLSITRDLVNQQAGRNFMRLELLMGTHMSHAKYRLAWENTSTQRVPFLPLHRRDLVSAEEGNRTFLQDGEKINWNKFQVMGDVLMIIDKSQATPYHDLVRNQLVEKLIRDAVSSMNDDGLYERSLQLENKGAKEKIRGRFWPERSFCCFRPAFRVYGVFD
ncbi:uncharacterized protein LAJ45_01593 [Morchella importuna]|uniref:uncharacterized protein n=1 Tax=Morchella importuna TaxID=1174673 RepID=UPI001E8E9140|nr:uncharacterized protein LAJ45_01593 [Morchella importuna]KAH8153826.1 hypothetical protein LAJ45_01593 [Morchella importuna]